ncbi:MAG: hypothetical protein LKF53_02040 [Solobacterium sp.]|jgi:hypothetical protein|nr:hypothetical protein [Solobacterium sp.]MCH4205159.1 hypothetical protein [Solobacterium sp.]MCH4226752.1 hypothetical protein [Solobacterium sp.]MCH4281919.1 hypothetical protein [Solobacterium sp.]
MGKDDYDVIVCKILTYLYAVLKNCRKRNDDYLQPMTKDFPIDADYFTLFWIV